MSRARAATTVAAQEIERCYPVEWAEKVAACLPAYTFHVENESTDAHSALETVARVSERTGGLSRPHAWLLLWGSILVSVYLAIALAQVSNGGSPQTGTVVIGLMLPTLITFSSVVAGTRDRFASRLRLPATYWVPVAITFVGYFVLTGVGTFGGGYPWWVVLLAGVAAFVLLSAPTVAYLLRGSRAATTEDPWRSHRLTPTALVVTIGIGVYLGLTTALSSFILPVAIVSVVGLLALAVLSLAPGAKWSTARAGVEWGRTQWIGFAISTAIMFTLALATVFAGKAIAPPIAVLSGVLVLTTMVAAAVTPRAR